jgi:hypothetical protein
LKKKKCRNFGCHISISDHEFGSLFEDFIEIVQNRVMANLFLDNYLSSFFLKYILGDLLLKKLPIKKIKMADLFKMTEIFKTKIFFLY